MFIVITSSVSVFIWKFAHLNTPRHNTAPINGTVHDAPDYQCSHGIGHQVPCEDSAQVHRNHVLKFL